MLEDLTSTPTGDLKALIEGDKPVKEIAATIRRFQIQQRGDQSRVLVGPQLWKENKALFDEMWARNREEKCPVCYALPPTDSPMNSDIPTYCTHWLCQGCWAEIKLRGKLECPICKEDLTTWMHSHY